MKKDDKTIFHIMMHIGLLLRQRVEGELSSIGVHHGQARVLFFLSHESNSTQADIARGLGLSRATVTNMLKPLEKSAWISRQTDPETNRAIRVCLTSEGRRLSKRVATIWSRIEKELRQDVSESERLALLKHMESFRRILGGCEPGSRDGR